MPSIITTIPNLDELSYILIAIPSRNLESPELIYTTSRVLSSSVSMIQTNAMGNLAPFLLLVLISNAQQKSKENPGSNLPS